MVVETGCSIVTTLEAIATSGGDELFKQDLVEAIVAKHPNLKEFLPLTIERYLPSRVERDKLAVWVEFHYERP